MQQYTAISDLLIFIIYFRFIFFFLAQANAAFENLRNLKNSQLINFFPAAIILMDLL